MEPSATAFPLRDDIAGAAALRAAEAMAEQLSQMLNVATVLIRQQRPVELTGFEERIGRLCAAVLDLPPQDGRRLRARLIALDQLLAALSAGTPS